MTKLIAWTERMEDRVKREVRITFLPGDRLKWQFKRADEDKWDYDTPPSQTDWENLLEKTEGFYNRRRATLKQLEVVRLLARQASAS